MGHKKFEELERRMKPENLARAKARTQAMIAEIKTKIDAGMEQAKEGKVLKGEKVFADLEKGL